MRLLQCAKIMEGSLSLLSDFGRHPLAERQNLLSLRIEEFKEPFPWCCKTMTLPNSIMVFIDVSMQLTAQL